MTKCDNPECICQSEPTCIDFGSDMAASIAFSKAHPAPAMANQRTQKFDDRGRTMDAMFDRTRYEQRSYEAYSRLLDHGHRA